MGVVFELPVLILFRPVLPVANGPGVRLHGLFDLPDDLPLEQAKGIQATRQDRP